MPHLIYTPRTPPPFLSEQWLRRNPGARDVAISAGASKPGGAIEKLRSGNGVMKYVGRVGANAPDENAAAEPTELSRSLGRPIRAWMRRRLYSSHSCRQKNVG